MAKWFLIKVVDGSTEYIELDEAQKQEIERKNNEYMNSNDLNDWSKTEFIYNQNLAVEILKKSRDFYLAKVQKLTHTADPFNLFPCVNQNAVVWYRKKVNKCLLLLAKVKGIEPLDLLTAEEIEQCKNEEI